jgi:hypothetical protein
MKLVSSELFLGNEIGMGGMCSMHRRDEEPEWKRPYER